MVKRIASRSARGYVAII